MIYTNRCAPTADRRNMEQGVYMAITTINSRCKGRLIGGLLAGWFLMTSLPCAFAFTENDAVRAIIGEASGQGYQGMLAVACAIRNRGTLKGVYGLKAKHVDRQPRWVWVKARKAWKEAKRRDITRGATHWHNVDREGENYWTRKLTKTVKINQHQFYR